jgi:putative autotransporter adhesin-like protein
MKTRIAAIIAMCIIVLGITNSTYAAASNNETVTVLTDISAINKIEVRGNVELYISDGSTDQVKVYNKYYSESALVQSTNGVLRIASYNPEKLIVWVTATNLNSISAYDCSVVKSFGNISKIEFNVDLHNNASAKLDLDAYSANVTLKDHAKADLSGSAGEFNLTHNVASTINNYNFKALHYTENKITFPAANKEDDLAGI